MKRIVCLMLIVLALCSVLCGCGNENWGIGNYTYTHVRVGNASDGYCATVSSWHDNELGAELHTEEFGSIYCSEGTYVMFEDGVKCPFCRG